MAQTDWLSNDALFFRELETGHKWASHTVRRLADAGIDARLTPMTIRTHVDNRSDYSNEADITVDMAGGQFIIESKSRNLTFSDDPTSFPYRTSFVDTVRGWDQKTTKPRAVVIVSQQTKAALVVSAKTRRRWTTIETTDRVRGITDVWYQIDRSLLLPFSTLTDYINRKRQS